MAVIKIVTRIDAPIERVFDLARSIDAHQKSTSQTSEKAIAGRTSGLISLNEEVTWQARHFGIKQKLSVKITKYERPYCFQDVMTKGAFSKMIHDHIFQSEDGKTVMEDIFEFHAPFGLLGKLVEKLFLTDYMRKFLIIRNTELKELAESDQWQKFLTA